MGHPGHISTLIDGQVKHSKLEAALTVYLVEPVQRGIL